MQKTLRKQTNWLELELRFLALKIVNHLEVAIKTVVLMGTQEKHV